MKPDFLLSQHFTFQEMTRTDNSIFQINNRVLAVDYVHPMQVLAYGMLEPIRCHFKYPLIIHCGFRCPELNAVIGGSPTSQHVKGEAADFHVQHIDCEDVVDFVRKKAEFPFGQVIIEIKNGVPWVHISLGYPWRALDRCGMALRRFEDGHYELMDKGI